MISKSYIRTRRCSVTINQNKETQIIIWSTNKDENLFGTNFSVRPQKWTLNCPLKCLHMKSSVLNRQGALNARGMPPRYVADKPCRTQHLEELQPRRGHSVDGDSYCQTQHGDRGRRYSSQPHIT